jgi:hypothetical protein
MPEARPAPRAIAEVERVVRWYVNVAYGRWEGPGRVPFFADRARVGSFEVDLGKLQERNSAEIFRLLVQLALYQSRRDVDIMAIQRSIDARATRAMTSQRRLATLI